MKANPVAKHMNAVSKPKTFKMKTRYSRKEKHKKGWQ
jgi:hypothetical protein